MEKETEWPLAGFRRVRLEMAAADCGLLENLKKRAFAGPSR
jgi:hypothetical protein